MWHSVIGCWTQGIHQDQISSVSQSLFTRVRTFFARLFHKCQTSLNLQRFYKCNWTILHKDRHRLMELWLSHCFHNPFSHTFLFLLSHLHQLNHCPLSRKLWKKILVCWCSFWLIYLDIYWSCFFSWWESEGMNMDRYQSWSRIRWVVSILCLSSEQSWLQLTFASLSVRP